MRKIALMFTFLLAAMFVWLPQASAQEVYAVTETHPSSGKVTDYYVVTESIQNKGNAFGVTVHSVGKNHSKNEYFNWFYANIKGKWHIVPGGQLAAAMQIDKISDSMFRSVVYGVFKTARQYM